jgi:hypothetical protein
MPPAGNNSAGYQRRVFEVVVLRFLIDIAAAALVVGTLSLITALLVLLGGKDIGLQLRHVRVGGAIVGFIYLAMATYRAIERHAKLPNPVDVAPAVKTPIPEEADVRSASPSN